LNFNGLLQLFGVKNLILKICVIKFFDVADILCRSDILRNQVRTHRRNVSCRKKINNRLFQRRCDYFEIRPLQIGHQLNQSLLSSSFPTMQKIIPINQIIRQLNDLFDKLIKMNVVKRVSIPFI
jgi:hypothetical protein